MEKGYTEVIENKEKHVGCNCCPYTEKKPKLWDVRFVYGNHTTLIKLCKEHLRELRNEIDRNLKEESPC